MTGSNDAAGLHGVGIEMALPEICKTCTVATLVASTIASRLLRTVMSSSLSARWWFRHAVSIWLHWSRRVSRKLCKVRIEWLARSSSGVLRSMNFQIRSMSALQLPRKESMVWVGSLIVDGWQERSAVTAPWCKSTCLRNRYRVMIRFYFRIIK